MRSLVSAMRNEAVGAPVRSSAAQGTGGPSREVSYDMRIVSWNLGANSVSKKFRDRAWHHLLDPDGLDADVALVQEAIPPDWLDERHHVHWRRSWPEPGPIWGTGIVVKKTYSLEPIVREVPDTRLVMARLTTGDQEFLVSSIHAFTTMDPAYFTDGRSLRFIDRLQANFDAIRNDCTDRFIVGGDLNSGRIAESTWPGHGHEAFWAALDQARFHSCPWSSTGEEVTTYTHPSGPFSGQADHVLLDARTAQGVVTTVPVLPAPLSDHLPLVVDVPPSALGGRDSGGEACSRARQVAGAAAPSAF
jgi:endonuclease/exonuclease/phosphatase (EEP) superfamily protein YafD